MALEVCDQMSFQKMGPVLTVMRVLSGFAVPGDRPGL